MPLSDEFAMWFVLGGIILLLGSAILEAMWEFGRQVRRDLMPAFLESNWKHIILVAWVTLLLIGGALFLLAYPIVAVIAIVVYWLVLPIVIGSRVRRRLLPPWDDLKAELMEKGYNERNYWRRGDWWKADSKTKRKTE